MSALAFTDSFLRNPKYIPEETATAVRDQFGPAGLITLTVALGLFEGWERFCHFLEIPQPEADRCLETLTEEGKHH